MTPKEALELATKIKKPVTKEQQALYALARAYKIKQTFTTYPLQVTQEKVNEFFRLIDEGCSGSDFKETTAHDVRRAYKQAFKLIFDVPDFPFISQETKKIRERIK